MLTALLWVSLARAETRSTWLEQHEPRAWPSYCATDAAEWGELTKGFGYGVLAYTWVSGPNTHEMHFSPDTCRALQSPRAPGFAESAAVLYHEWWHAQFLDRDEGGTECGSLWVYRNLLRKEWHLGKAEIRRDYQLAVAAHKTRAFWYPAYAGWCDA